jgi:hypothetical protein
MSRTSNDPTKISRATADGRVLLTWLRDSLEVDASEGSPIPRYVAAIGAMNTQDALHLLAYACLKGGVLPTLPRLD